MGNFKIRFAHIHVQVVKENIDENKLRNVL